MRLYLKLTPNSQIVPFDYQRQLVGAFHKWLGENELHDDISLYSLSWLDGGKMRRDKNGLEFRDGAEFCISSPLEDLHKAAVDGIFRDQEICWGMRASEVTMKVTPDFGMKYRFYTKSPVLIKRQRTDAPHQQYYYYTDEKASILLTETLKNKMQRFGLEGDVNVRFDTSYPNPKIRKVTFKNIDIKASACPVIVEGDPQTVSFAWDVGVGNSTGIGFGCLR